jgi:hypothetical protein
MLVKVEGQSDSRFISGKREVPGMNYCDQVPEQQEHSGALRNQLHYRSCHLNR